METAPRGGSGARTRARWAGAVAALAGFAWFLKSVGAHTLDPTRLGWLGDGDFAAHALGWLFFRNEPWTLPLGTIGGLAHPIGTTLGFTDANPWVSVLLKPLSRGLPEHFQFIGPWLAVCFALQGFFGAKIVEAFTPSAAHRVLGGALFALAPPLLHRIGHDTLCAHWLVLAAIWLHVRPGSEARGTLSWAFVLVVIAAGVHPYLAVMVTGLAIALFVRLYATSQLRAAAMLASSAAAMMLTGAIFALLGYLRRDADLSLDGFGVYASDLLALINSRGYSRWIPALPSRDDAGEGFGYLGIGAIGLGMAAAALHVRRGVWPAIPRAHLPLVAAAAAMGCFALSNHVTAAGHVVLTLRGAYEPFHALVEPFRSSGRFLWPLHYVVLTGLVALVVRPGLIRPAVSGALLLAAVVAQAAEVPGIWPGTRIAPGGEWPRVRAAEWAAIGPPYRDLVLYPPFYMTVPPDCEPSPFTWREVVQLSDLAYRRGLSINSGYLARFDSASIGRYCRDLRTAFAEGRFASDAIYVLRPGTADGVERAGRGALTCGTLDGFRVCVGGASRTAFGARLSGG